MNGVGLRAVAALAVSAVLVACGDTPDSASTPSPDPRGTTVRAAPARTPETDGAHRVIGRYAVRVRRLDPARARRDWEETRVLVVPALRKQLDLVGPLNAASLRSLRRSRRLVLPSVAQLVCRPRNAEVRCTGTLAEVVTGPNRIVDQYERIDATAVRRRGRWLVSAFTVIP